MPTSTLFPSLANHPFVRNFTPEQVETLAAHAKPVRFEGNHVIFPEGDTCAEFYLIVSGKVALEIAPDGEALRIETLSGGDELGWSSILGKGKVYQARTLERVEAIAFDGNDLRARFERDPAFGYAFMLQLIGVVSERLRSTRLQVLDMYWTPAKRAGA